MRLFAECGLVNTAEVAMLAAQAARERRIEHLVVATTGGRTVQRFLPCPAGLHLVAVTHAFGFERPGANEMPDDVRADLEAADVRVVTAAHALSGAERGLSKQFGGVYPVEIVAHTLRMFGQGVKVAVEVAVMALDAGAIPHGRDVMAVGGTSEGADTAVVVRPAYASTILGTRVVEIICMPRQ
jgi:hypothetical protein